MARGDGYERGGTIALLEQLAEDPAYPVRRAAARRLEELDRPVVSVAPPRSMRGPDYYRGIVEVTYGEREAAARNQRRHSAPALSLPGGAAELREHPAVGGSGFL